MTVSMLEEWNMNSLLVALALLTAAGAPPSDAEKEAFLAQGEVVHVQSAPGGTTGSLRVTLQQGSLTHDADVQTIDEASPEKELDTTVELDFRDSYRNDVAAYRLDRMLGLGMVPVTVVRPHDGREAAFTWWVDRPLMTEKERYEKKEAAPDTEAWNRQIEVVRVFDQLIWNFDRNLGNLIIDADWRLWMIDHSRAFKIFKDLKDEKQLTERCERHLLEALRALQKPALQARMHGLLSDAQIDGLLGRRDRIVAHYDRLIRDRGKAEVLYDLPRGASSKPRP